MTKYRAILLVPSIVEFENSGTPAQVTMHVQRIANGMGKATSLHPSQNEAVYEPKVLECVVIDGVPSPEPELPPEPDLAA